MATPALQGAARKALGVAGNLQIGCVVDDVAVREALAKLDKKQLFKVLKNAFKTIGRQAVANLRPFVPVAKVKRKGRRAGGLKRAVTSKIGTYNNAVVLLVGPKWEGGQHQHLVEFGTKSRRLLGKGRYKAGINRGKMPAQPYLGPFIKREESSIQAAVAASVEQELSNL